MSEEELIGWLMDNAGSVWITWSSFERLQEHTVSRRLTWLNKRMDFMFWEA